MNDSSINFSQQAANYGDVIYTKSFSAFNGYNNSVSAKIVVTVDPGGVIKAGNAEFGGAIPGKIQFFTANDNGKLHKAGEFDKAGRFITNEHWSVTRNPSGNPLLLMLNGDDPGNGAALSLRRSRGTYDNPLSVKENDSIFKISWYAHDGQSYKESSSIHVILDDSVSLGSVPSSIVFKTFDYKTGQPSESMAIESDKSVSLQGPLKLRKIKDEQERDSVINTPEIGSLIFLLNLDTVQVFTATRGWKNLF